MHKSVVAFYYIISTFFIFIFIVFHIQVKTWATEARFLLNYVDEVTKGEDFRYTDELKNNLLNEVQNNPETIKYHEYFSSQENAYPANLMRFIHAYLKSVQPYFISSVSSNSGAEFNFLINNGKPYTLSVNFVKKDEKYYLNNISNFSNIFKELNCQKIYLANENTP